MISSPPRWTTAELTEDAAAASARFRAERLAVSGSWETHYKHARGKFEQLFSKLSDLNPSAITDENLADAYSLGLGEALRYLAGPPISDDDLQVIADVDSIAPGVLKKNPAALRKVFGVIERVIDPHRFPWTDAGIPPTQQQREAALVASSVLLAAQRIATERRSEGKDNQESKVKDYLRSLGFTEVPTMAINTIVKGPQAMQFCAECQLGERKADVVVRLHDTRLMAIECKVSNSATNSVKRLNNDAAVKAEYWIKQFGVAQVVPAAVLAGVFKVLNLEQAQARGLSLFWSHDLDKLGELIESTK
ncbi:XamI family restriction endonuclease [Burkholderia ubonensis]|uniref:XamI family restriction endonuclease n=1 Tax=Burkholderia ubonensis TaxID=101571 RepID=UPI0007586B93|nr:XamI family restriction endonuclease [Burkholderia ubonensis]KVA76468.1 restriction endonuclease [Burkholderia ubonensis]KVO55299.1 restriction endonuclease [Burkholderia ubonensis]KVT01276.1 restriction endonuclease [Burkholderia ubonensis]KVT16227.1 restriction endonuclease [Burkholderia ubonensis]KVT29388.1 restriction endonuclease [Burkholderia ubonensis]